MKDKPVGEILKDLCNQKGMKQKDLAMVSGVAPTTISKIESGNTRPARRTLWKLADTLDKLGFEGAWDLTGGDRRVPGTNMTADDIQRGFERSGETHD